MEPDVAKLPPDFGELAELATRTGHDGAIYPRRDEMQVFDPAAISGIESYDEPSNPALNYESHVHEEAHQEDRQAEEESGSVRGPESRRVAQGDEEAQVEPYFPSVEDAQAIHDQSVLDHGQAYAALLDPGKLDSALGRAANYWQYGQGAPHERMADAAGALAHGIGAAQAFEDGNKRTAYHTTRYFLDANDLGHLSPVDSDDEELADHLIGHGEGTHSLEDTQGLFRSRLGEQRQANILDHVHPGLDPSVWLDPESPEPRLKPEHAKWITETIKAVLAKHGYEGVEEWLSLVLTGSLTTYQYSEHSDCDISLFVDAPKFPDWSRGEMIGIMVSEFDDVKLPGTTHPLQAFVVNTKKLTKEDLYQPGLRSGYDLQTQRWLVPPEKSRSHDVDHEMNGDYTYALEVADKAASLLRYEPAKAVMFYKQLHHRRQRDQAAGKGDYSQSNIAWKMLENRGLADQIRTLMDAGL